MVNDLTDWSRQIAELSRGLVEDYRADRRGKLQRTLFSGSSAANSKVNKVSTPASIRVILSQLDRKQKTQSRTACGSSQSFKIRKFRVQLQHRGCGRQEN